MTNAFRSIDNVRDIRLVEFNSLYPKFVLQPSDAYTAITQVDKLRAEPEKIRIWREENARRIEKKGAHFLMT